MVDTLCIANGTVVVTVCVADVVMVDTIGITNGSAVVTVCVADGCCRYWQLLWLQYLMVIGSITVRVADGGCRGYSMCS